MSDEVCNTKGIPEGTWSPRLLAIRETVEHIGKSLPPDDDWMPVVFVEGTFPADMPDVRPEDVGKEGIIIVGFTYNVMESDESKDFLAGIMRGLAIKMKAKGMTFLSTVWMSQVKDPAYFQPGPENESEQDMKRRALDEAEAHRKKYGPPSKDPNRIERIMLFSVYYGGIDDGTKLAYADIKRSPGKHPVLQDWHLHDAAEMGFTGRFYDAVYEGIKEATRRREREAK
jgi:hypothetical protein